MNITIDDKGKWILFFGAVLFLFGMLQGLMIPAFMNPRMALSAHLAAVQSGMALMIFGIIWSYLRLASKLEFIARWFGIFGMYLVWISMLIAAVNGASGAMPIAGGGFNAGDIGELLVKATIYSGVGLSLISGCLIVFGLYLKVSEKVA